MNEWLIAAFVLLLSLVPCGIVCLRGDPMDRLVALELAGVIDALAFLLIAQGLHQDSFFDLGLTMALLSFAGGLVYARFMERWA